MPLLPRPQLPIDQLSELKAGEPLRRKLSETDRILLWTLLHSTVSDATLAHQFRVSAASIAKFRRFHQVPRLAGPNFSPPAEIRCFDRQVAPYRRHADGRDGSPEDGALSPVTGSGRISGGPVFRPCSADRTPGARSSVADLYDLYAWECLLALADAPTPILMRADGPLALGLLGFRFERDDVVEFRDATLDVGKRPTIIALPNTNLVNLGPDAKPSRLRVTSNVSLSAADGGADVSTPMDREVDGFMQSISDAPDHIKGAALSAFRRDFRKAANSGEPHTGFPRAFLDDLGITDLEAHRLADEFERERSLLP